MTAPLRRSMRILVTATSRALLLVLAACDRSDARDVTVLRGNAKTVNDTRTAIGFDGRHVTGPRLDHIDVDGGWIVAGASWFDGRSWHDNGTPTCLDHPLPQPIELGVVEAASGHDAPGRGVVVWLKYLSRS